MMHALVTQLLRLSGRERMLLAALVLALIGGAGAGVLWPLAERRAAAEMRLTDVRAEAFWVSARADEARLLKAVDTPEPVPPMGLAGVQSSLERAGLIEAVTVLSARSGAAGGIELRLDAVAFDRLIQWLTQVRPVWGYRLESFRIERSAQPGLVTAAFDLVPKG